VDADELTRAMPGSAETFRSGDALCAFAPDLRIRSRNRAADELTGITAEEARRASSRTRRAALAERLAFKMLVGK
jgi:PAS domain-containing protein